MVLSFHGRRFWFCSLFSAGFLLYPLSLTAADLLVGGLPPDQNYHAAAGAIPALLSDIDHPALSSQELPRQVLNSAAIIHQVTIGNPIVRGPIPHPPSPPPPPTEPPVSISFTDPFSIYGNLYYFLADEKTLLTSVLQILPAQDLTGITEIQSAPYENDGVFDTLGSTGVVTLYLPPQSARSTDGFYPLLAYHMTEAIGENAYLQALTPAQQQEWQSLTNQAQPGDDPQQEFGEFYSLWTLDSYNLIQSALSSPPSSANPTLAQVFFIASQFLGSPSQIQGRTPFLGHYIASLEAYTGGNIQNNLISPSAFSVGVESRAGLAPGSILSIGNYTFHVENNTLVSWSSGLGAFTSLNPPVALPAAWISSIAAFSSSAKGS
jgi:hypothetical protein